MVKSNLHSTLVLIYHLQDILHPCDIAEDIGIAYGYMNIKDVLPPSQTFGSQQPLNKFSDLLRLELAAAGYKETLNFSLCSREEIGEAINRPIDPEAVHIANPKSQDFQVGRTTLIPGLLKFVASNKSNKVTMLIRIYSYLISILSASIPSF